MADTYTFSRHALLKRIGLTPGKKMLIFFISATLLTIPLPYVYNSITLILFLAYTLLSFNKENIKVHMPLLPFAGLYLLMVFSLAWSVDFTATVRALSREAALLFIPLAFCLNMVLHKRGVGKVLESYSLGIFIFALYLTGRAVFRYNETGNTDVFFYHELATNDINAIYLSVMTAMAVFFFLSKRKKTFWGYAALVFLAVFLFLLSSKVIIITSVVLGIVYFLFFSRLTKRGRIAAAAIFVVAAGILGYYGKIGERIASEFNYQEIDNNNGGVHRVTLAEAWNKEQFNANDYLNGTAFRFYQVRIFNEMLQDDPIFLTGYGLSASPQKVEEKGVEHNMVHGSEDSGLMYNKLNFHNQYVEVFAELGIFGLLLVITLLGINVRNALKNKEFVHIAFAFLMISLFLTESFLWRQRGVVFFTTFYCLFNTGLLRGSAASKAI